MRDLLAWRRSPIAPTMSYRDRAVALSSADQWRLDVEETWPARAKAERPIPESHDYEYDEAHDVSAWPLSGAPAPHPVHAPPAANLGQDGDYGYDEAHDFGAS
jgi:hypothetical protein